MKSKSDVGSMSPSSIERRYAILSVNGATGSPPVKIVIAMPRSLMSAGERSPSPVRNSNRPPSPRMELVSAEITGVALTTGEVQRGRPEDGQEGHGVAPQVLQELVGQPAHRSVAVVVLTTTQVSLERGPEKRLHDGDGEHERQEAPGAAGVGASPQDLVEDAVAVVQELDPGPLERRAHLEPGKRLWPCGTLRTLDGLVGFQLGVRLRQVHVHADLVRFDRLLVGAVPGDDVHDALHEPEGNHDGPRGHIDGGLHGPPELTLTLPGDELLDRLAVSREAFLHSEVALDGLLPCRERVA